MTLPLPSRRKLLSSLAQGVALAVLAPALRVGAAPTPVSSLAGLEQRHGGRLGVCALDPRSMQPLLAHRADERFALCSTFKLLLAAAVLREADAGRMDLSEPVRFGREVLVPHSPVVEQHAEAGALSVRELAHAIQTTSDNAAANLLLGRFGGPSGFTTYLRTLGDDTTRLDRLEPTMNRVLPGETQDTTTPAAMASTVARLFAGDLLAATSRATLREWMIETGTGLKRLRAGFPADWQAGDKTGTALAKGMPNRHNDVAVIWREGQPVLVVAAYYEADRHYPRMRAEDDAVLAAVGRIVAPTTGQAPL